jgi:dienelactone hydrolase
VADGDRSEGADARADGGFVVPDTGHGRGVLVLCEARGDALAQEACARLARHGFVAFAPRLPENAAAALSDAERGAVDAAIHALFCEHATDGARVGALGFGRGGWLALDAAARGGRIGAVVSFGGAPPHAEELSVATLEAPVLAVFAEKDPAVEAGLAVALEERLRAEAVACVLRIEPGVVAEYLDPARADHYDAAAARASWDAALARLRAEL